MIEHNAIEMYLRGYGYAPPLLIRKCFTIWNFNCCMVDYASPLHNNPTAYPAARHGKKGGECPCGVVQDATTNAPHP